MIIKPMPGYQKPENTDPIKRPEKKTNLLEDDELFEEERAKLQPQPSQQSADSASAPSSVQVQSNQAKGPTTDQRSMRSLFAPGADSGTHNYSSSQQPARPANQDNQTNPTNPNNQVSTNTVLASRQSSQTKSEAGRKKTMAELLVGSVADSVSDLDKQGRLSQTVVPRQLLSGAEEGGIHELSAVGAAISTVAAVLAVLSMTPAFSSLPEPIRTLTVPAILGITSVIIGIASFTKVVRQSARMNQILSIIAIGLGSIALMISSLPNVG